MTESSPVRAARRIPATGRETDYLERVIAIAPGLLVHIVDELTGRAHLVDTGAIYNIFPHHSSSLQSEPLLTGRRGKWIPCWEEWGFGLSFIGCRFPAGQCEVCHHCGGFLRNHKLLVDPAVNRLVDTWSLQSFATVNLPWMAAPMATASSGLTALLGVLPKISLL